MNKLKFTLLTSFGAILEYYDFIIYGMMANYLSEVFFASGNSTLNFFKVFSVMAIGYLARPLGGFLFGIISDIYGRKKSLLISMSLMATATFSIGLLPTYAKGGVFAIILLTICRFMQGLSFGAEIPSVATLIKEHIEENRIGKCFGWIVSSTSIGALLASLTVFLLSYFFCHHQIITWAWRIPFLIGSILAIAVFITRTYLPKDSESHIQFRATSYRLLLQEIFKNHLASLAIGIFITIFFSYLIILTLYLPVYLNTKFAFSISDFYAIMTIGIFIAAIAAPIFGHLSDHFPKKILLCIIPLSFVVFLFISLQLMQSQTYTSLVFFIFGYEVFISLFAANCLPILTELFPSRIRATGIGACYNLAYSLASLCPLLLNPLLASKNHIMAINGVSLFIAFLTIIAAYALIKIQSKQKLFIERQTISVA